MLSQCRATIEVRLEHNILWFSDNIVSLQIFQSQKILFQMQTLRPYFFVALAYIEIMSPRLKD